MCLLDLGCSDRGIVSGWLRASFRMCAHEPSICWAVGLKPAAIGAGAVAKLRPLRFRRLLSLRRVLLLSVQELAARECAALGRFCGLGVAAFEWVAEWVTEWLGLPEVDAVGVFADLPEWLPEWPTDWLLLTRQVFSSR